MRYWLCADSDGDKFCVRATNTASVEEVFALIGITASVIKEVTREWVDLHEYMYFYIEDEMCS